MTTESETKKPPAHEVIVKLLQEYAGVVRHEARDASHNPETAASHVLLARQASALCIVLMRMYIPGKDRPAVADTLRDSLHVLFPADEAADNLTEIADVTRDP